MKRFHAVREFSMGEKYDKKIPLKNKTRTLNNWKSAHNGTGTMAMNAAWMSHSIPGRALKLLIFLSLKSKENYLLKEFYPGFGSQASRDGRVSYFNKAYL